MKFIKDIFNKDAVFIVLVAFLAGMLIGVFFQSSYSLGIRTFYHNIYTKLNQNTQKDTKTIIMDKVSADLDECPQTDIFENRKKKPNRIISVIKNIFTSKQKEKKPTINDNF